MNESYTPLLGLWAWRYNTKTIISPCYEPDPLANYISINIYQFFVVMETNVNHQVVTSFVLQGETAATITEALSIIKTWNPTWDPKCFMVGKCDEEIKSIRNIFLRTYMHCFNLFVLIKNLCIVQNTIHFWKRAKKYQEWFGFVSTNCVAIVLFCERTFAGQ